MPCSPVAVLLCFLLTLPALMAAPLAALAALAQDQTPEELILVLDSPDRQGLPRRFRTAGDSISPDLADPPSMLGLDALRVSGSAQFSRTQLLDMLERLPAPFTVVDLRQESHGFLGGQAVSWYGPRDWASTGKTLDQVHEDEMLLLERAGTLGRVLASEIIRKDARGAVALAEQFTLEVTSAQTEAQILALHGLGYLRLPVTAHFRPSDQVVEEFLVFWRNLPADTWLHFHGHAGDDRTTTFMLMADILANAHRVTFADIVRRQHLLGGADLAGNPPLNAKRAAYLERAAFLENFYAFARQTPPGKPPSWTEWLEGQKNNPVGGPQTPIAP